MFSTLKNQRMEAIRGRAAFVPFTAFWRSMGDGGGRTNWRI
jgi:hypothetical protein